MFVKPEVQTATQVIVLLRFWRRKICVKRIRHCSDLVCIKPSGIWAMPERKHLWTFMISPNFFTYHRSLFCKRFFHSQSLQDYQNTRTASKHMLYLSSYVSQVFVWQPCSFWVYHVILDGGEQSTVCLNLLRDVRLWKYGSMIIYS